MTSRCERSSGNNAKGYSQVYETKHYIPSDNFLQDVKTVVSLNFPRRENDSK